MSLKHELQSIISGNGSVRNGKIIQAITNHLRRKKETVQGTAKAKLIKEQEAKILIEFICHVNSNLLLLSFVPASSI